MSESPPPTFTQVSQLVPLRDPVYLRVPVDEWDTMRERLEALDCDVTWVPVFVGAFVGGSLSVASSALKGEGLVEWGVAGGLLVIALALIPALSEKRKRVKVQKQGIMDLFELVEDRHGFPAKQAPAPPANP